MEACIDEEMPATTELEENLQNGVFLAKVGHFFAPKVVPLKRIYDKDQSRYQVRKIGGGEVWRVEEMKRERFESMNKGRENEELSRRGGRMEL